MLDFNVTFIITIINIAFLCFILRLVLFKPVTKFINERAKKTEDTIINAEKDREAAKELLSQYEEKLKTAEADAEAILQAARGKAEKEASRIMAEAKTASENRLEAARTQIEAERQAALLRFRIEAAALVVAASGRLVQRDFNGDDQRRFADLMLDELAAKKGY